MKSRTIIEISQNTAAVRGATQQEERKNGYEPEFVTFYEALRDGEK